jgi:quercetin dioxygenase-like cupin family protein
MAARVFLRGIEGERYDLRAERLRRLESARVIKPDQRSWRDEKAVGHEDASPQSKAKWMVGPGDEPFLTQTVQCHFVRIEAGGSNGGHGHQNEAAFYILEGRGYEIHDGVRYDWSAGDLVVVHADSRHQHFNASPTDPALAIVVKPKALWMFLGLTQQGRRGTASADGDLGDREGWSRLWTPGVERLRKVVHTADEPWRSTRDGRLKWLARAGMDVRLFGVDIALQAIEPGGRSAAHWHMADELCYVLSGRGHTLEWQVEAEIDDRYYARVARAPRRFGWEAGDVFWVGQNTIHQHVAEAGEGVELLVTQNRAFKLLGYDATVYREPATGWAGEEAAGRRVSRRHAEPRH